MQKRSSINRELNESLHPSGSLAEAGPIKNQAAVELGRLGGLKGGKARAEKLSPRRRKQIAKQAALARWNKSEE